jgi:hypothetical protein
VYSEPTPKYWTNNQAAKMGKFTPSKRINYEERETELSGKIQG